MISNRLRLWLRWVVANAVAEMIGLGAVFAIGIGLFSGLANSPGVIPTLLTLLLMTAAGALEGFIVESAQWWAMRPGIPSLPRRAWVIATIIGALVAWAIGSLPVTFSAPASRDTPASGPEPTLAIALLSASAMGAAAGLVLSFAQWRVLRRHVEGAWWWLPANAAWAVGLPLVFVAIDLAQRAGSSAAGVAVMALGLLVTGAVVGAIHGLVLVRLANRSGQPARSTMTGALGV